MKILLIDDEKDIRITLADVLGKDGHEVETASGGVEGLERFSRNLPDLVLLDIRMPDLDGLEVLRRIKQVDQSSVEVVMITGHGDEDTAITALRHGAFDYFRKPVDVRELLIGIDRIREHLDLRRKVSTYRDRFDALTAEAIRSANEEVARVRKAFFRQVGLGNVGLYSEALRSVFDIAQKYHRQPHLPVLIEGETGTGKELVARYLHFGGEETAAPFVPVNSGEYREELFASELFGYEGGAFTGASTVGKKGKFDAARGGTLFLDEIGDMPLSLQPKLLRVLQEKEFYRVGGLERIDADVRIVCATNRRLEEEVRKGTFREDLFHRISAGRIAIPPLRHRKEAVVPLAYEFLEEAARTTGVRCLRIAPGAERALREFDWPGNVRQLKNTVERALIIHEPGILEIRHLSFLPLSERDSDRPRLGRADFDLPDEGFDLEAFNLDVVRKALEKNGGNKSKTAEYLGLTRKALQSRLKKLES